MQLALAIVPMTIISTKDKSKRDLQTISLFYFGAILARALNNREKLILRVNNNRMFNCNL